MPTRYPGTPAETAALDAYIKLMRHGPLCQRDLGAKLLRSDGKSAGGWSSRCAGTTTGGSSWSR